MSSRMEHDWSAAGAHRFRRLEPVAVQDETLREGLQSPTAADPPVESKLRLLHLMEALRVDGASLGIPAAGPRQHEAVRRLCAEVANARLTLSPNCGGRTLVQDVRPILGIRDATGVALEACLFIGSSPIRRFVEGWTVANMVDWTREAVGFAVREGLDVMYITEDTTRSSPEDLRALISAAVHAGAKRVCLCDTVGSADPPGVANLVEWTTNLLHELGGEVAVDWHGHNDRGLGMANALAAVEAGVDRVHATALGLGERVGNTEMEILLTNLRLLGVRKGDLTALPEYTRLVAEATGVAIPARAPVVGGDAFRTATGIHAAAVIKARRKGDDRLADRVYSGVPAAWVGRRQEIAVGHLSGASNVRHFLAERGIQPREELVREILFRAKESGRVLAEDEVMQFVRSASGASDV